MRCVSKNCPFKNVNADNCHFFGGCDFARTQPTNGDRIRTMTDEELAELLNRVQQPCNFCQLAFWEGACTETLCDDAMMNWLKQPAKEDV